MCSLGTCKGFRACVTPHPVAMPYFLTIAKSPLSLSGIHNVRTKGPSSTSLSSLTRAMSFVIFLSYYNLDEQTSSSHPRQSEIFHPSPSGGHPLSRGTCEIKSNSRRENKPGLLHLLRKDWFWEFFKS